MEIPQAAARANPSESTITLLPGASLIICSRNRARMLSDTIESVLQGNEVPAELIVVDQSDAPHRPLADMSPRRGCEIRYLWTHSRGLSAARNEGIQAARFNLLAIIDDDMYVERDWFGTLIRALVKEGPRSAITGCVLPATAEVPGGFVPSLVQRDTPAIYEGRIGTDVLAGGHMAAYRSDVLALGGFDERLGAGGQYPAAEDNDLGFRLLEAGCRIRFTPEAIVYHRAWRSNRDYLKMRWNYGRGKGGYYAKHLNLRDTYMLRRAGYVVAQHVFLFLRRLPAERRKGTGDLIFSLGIVSGAIQWMLTQHKRR